MPKLTYTEKFILKELFQMERGYVLDFSNKTFQEFVWDSVGIDIYQKYPDKSKSKAKCLMAFIEDFGDKEVGKLLLDLLEYYVIRNSDDEYKNWLKCQPNQNLLRARDIASRLLSNGSPSEVLLEIPPIREMTVRSIVEEVQNAISRCKPEAAIDRLHTFTVKYIEDICNKYGINVDFISGNTKKRKPLHSLWGELVKKYLKNERIKSETTIIIMKSSISIMDKFNSSRNNESMAHGNHLLNSVEAEYIVKSICNMLNFIDTIESSVGLGDNK